MNSQLKSSATRRRALIGATVAVAMLLLPAAAHASATKIGITDKGSVCEIDFTSSLTAVTPDPGLLGGILNGRAEVTCTRNMRLVTNVTATRQLDQAVVASDQDACHFEDPGTPQGCLHMESNIGPTHVIPGDYKVDYYAAMQIYNAVPSNNPAYERWASWSVPGCWASNKGGEVLQCTHTDLLHTG
jgi:hypothetical protein